MSRMKVFRRVGSVLDPPDELFAMKTFGYSIVYLMALFAFLMFDHWLRLADFYWN